MKARIAQIATIATLAAGALLAPAATAAETTAPGALDRVSTLVEPSIAFLQTTYYGSVYDTNTETWFGLSDLPQNRKRAALANAALRSGVLSSRDFDAG
jgi:hypothetical protein